MPTPTEILYDEANKSPTFVAVTGGQGTGKSTFSRSIRETLIKELPTLKIELVSGLGDSLKAHSVPLGSAATADSVAAVYSAHLRRELKAPSGLHILDRCAVDGLAYVRSLHVTSPLVNDLYTQITSMMVRRLFYVVHLEMTGIFETTTATHESLELRSSVASQIPVILHELKVPHISINAAQPDATKVVLEGLMSTVTQR